MYNILLVLLDFLLQARLISRFPQSWQSLLRIVRTTDTQMFSRRRIADVLIYGFAVSCLQCFCQLAAVSICWEKRLIVSALSFLQKIAKMEAEDGWTKLTISDWRFFATGKGKDGSMK